MRTIKEQLLDMLWELPANTVVYTLIDGTKYTALQMYDNVLADTGLAISYTLRFITKNINYQLDRMVR